MIIFINKYKCYLYVYNLFISYLKEVKLCVLYKKKKSVCECSCSFICNIQKLETTQMSINR